MAKHLVHTHDLGATHLHRCRLFVVLVLPLFAEGYRLGWMAMRRRRRRRRRRRQRKWTVHW